MVVVVTVGGVGATFGQQKSRQRLDPIIGGSGAMDLAAFAFLIDQSGFGQRLEVMRERGGRQANPLSQRTHGQT